MAQIDQQASINPRSFRIAIFIIQVALVVYFLIHSISVTPFGPTVDDAWIHFQFVRNLAQDGQIAFNPGEWSTGTTSMLWDVVLAAGVCIGIPVVLFSISIGILLYLIFGQLVFTIFRGFWPGGWNAFFAAFLVIATGNILWYSLSGMETMLFLVLGLLWIEAYRKERFILSGIIAGALVLTRLEGLLFLLMGGAFGIFRFGFREGSKKAILQVVFALPFILPSIILNLLITGEFYPNTMGGKQWLYGFQPGLINLSFHGARRFIGVWVLTLFENSWFPELIARPTTFQYPLIRLLSRGRIDKAPPEFPLEPFPMWVQLLTLLAGSVIMFILLRGLWRTMKPAVLDLWHRRSIQGWQYLLFWFVGHNLIYLLLMPNRGQGGRYQAVNFILAGFFLIVGIESADSRRKLKGRFLHLLPKYLILLLYIFSIITWGDIYAKSVKHVNDVHRGAGEWLRDNLPSDTKLAVFDVGAIKYFSGMPIIDIAGLTDNEALEHVLKGDITPYLKDRGAEYLVMVEELFTERERKMGKIDYLNSAFYDILGIRREVGRTVELEAVIKFTVPREDWHRHWVALRTHSPVIAIYKIHWLEQ